MLISTPVVLVNASPEVGADLDFRFGSVCGMCKLHKLTHSMAWGQCPAACIYVKLPAGGIRVEIAEVRNV